MAKTPLTAPARRGVPPSPQAYGQGNPQPAVKSAPIKVRATQTGYYDHCRRREGDVFIIANQQAFSPNWMELCDPLTRERTTTAPQALRQAHDEILGGSISGGGATGDADPLGDN